MTGKINEEIVIITIQFIDCLLCSGTVPSISYILISNSKQAYGFGNSLSLLFRWAIWVIELNIFLKPTLLTIIVNDRTHHQKSKLKNYILNCYATYDWYINSKFQNLSKSKFHSEVIFIVDAVVAIFQHHGHMLKFFIDS